MVLELTLQELLDRRARFIERMGRVFPGWDSALIMENVNQYYFTGSIQDGIVVIERGGRLIFGVKRSIERALSESPLPPGDIVGISTYKDLAKAQGGKLGEVYVEGDTMPVVAKERLAKYFSMDGVGFLDSLVRSVRSVKSPLEIEAIRMSGEAHRLLLEERVPSMLRKGVGEAEFCGELVLEMCRLGYQGISRFHQFQIEMGIGQVNFGTNSLCPTRFDGPDGSRGSGPWFPFYGDPDKRLASGEPVFLDIAFGKHGYHSDKTQVYFFGGDVPEEFLRAHRFCLGLQKRLAEMLKPGEIPSRLYQVAMDSLSDEGSGFLDPDYFMGVNAGGKVKFLGHGVGLNVDEFPVIARGFDEPFEENMVVAIEPKYAVAGIGMAGVEDTYLVGANGGECLTGGGRDVIVV
jgi:Xaa-Pro aminopeptidase